MTELRFTRNQTHKLDAEQIKDWVEVDDIVEYYDIDLPVESDDWLRGHCPFHDDNNPSFGFNRESKQFHCFVCGGGDVITFIEKVEGVEFQEALKILRDRFTNLGSDTVRAGEQIQRKLDTVLDEGGRKARKEVREMLKETRTVCSEMLRDLYYSVKDRHRLWRKLAVMCLTPEDRDWAMGNMLDVRAFVLAGDCLELEYDDMLEEISRLVDSGARHNEKILAIVDIYEQMCGKISALEQRTALEF